MVNMYRIMCGAALEDNVCLCDACQADYTSTYLHLEKVGPCSKEQQCEGCGEES